MSNSHPDWHSLDPDDSLRRLDSSIEGLDDQQSQARLTKHGPNTLPSPPRQSAWLRLLLQFHNVLIYVLMAAGVIAGALGHMVDAVVILAVVVINALIGFIQEGKAEKAMDAIGRMLALKARVRRNGKWTDMAAEHLVPGDIIKVKAGDRVPADIRLLKAHDLQIDQAALTGESLPVDKHSEPVEQDSELADRNSMIYSGSMTTSGQATGVVVVTGSGTELGRISGMLEQVEKLTTPLLQRINHFARILTIIILAATGLVIALGAIVHGLPLTEGLLAGIALAVAAIPEGLPAIITITLAIGVQQMAKRKAIIRRLPAVETLGSVDTICSDKTGTLTRNEQTVRSLALAQGIVQLDNDKPDPSATEALTRAAVLCNDFDPDGQGGDPLEQALIEMAKALGSDVGHLRHEHERIDLIPFSSVRKYMASLSAGLLTLKGAPEAVISLCSRQGASKESDRPINPDFWHQQLDRLTTGGLRVLAIAEKTLDPKVTAIDRDQELQGLTLLGLVGFADPPRPGVPEAVAACQQAGIRIKMITGDHAATAMAIAREIGIADNDSRALSGRDLDNSDDEQLAKIVQHTDVFARTTPEHKLRLVTALQSHRHVVAMTGDGANDAPALKRADIGVAMGIKGTEASRQAAEMVLADDNFATIVGGVEEGRGVYDNIRKAVLFLLPTNTAQSMVIVLSVLAGLSLPITPVQILWVNMAIAITLALALAFEPLESDVMARRPRPVEQGLLTSFVIARVLWVGAVLTAGTFVLYHWVLMASGNEDLARTLAVNVLVAGQLTYLFNCRRWQQSSLGRGVLFANPWAWLAAGLLVIMQLLFTNLPAAQTVFSTTALPLSYWLIVVAFGLLVFILVELEKLITRRLGLAWASPGGT